MKIFPWKKAGLIVILIFPLIRINAQSLLKITEITTGGKVIAVSPMLDKKDSTKLKRYPNIDINSTIIIKVQSDLIRQEANNWIPVKGNLPVTQMKSISDFLTKRLDLIKAIKYNSDDPQKRVEAYQCFSDQTKPILNKILSLDPTNPLQIKIEDIFSERQKDASITYNKVFDVLQDEINAITQEYKNTIEKNKITFRLGTYINSTPVHLEGFDSYKEGDYYFVSPFITNISEQQRKEFDDYKQLAQKANNDANNALTEKLKEGLDIILDSLNNNLTISIKEPLSSLERELIKTGKLTNEVKTIIAYHKEEFDNLKTLITLLITHSKEANSIAYIKWLEEYIPRIYNNFTTLYQSLKDSISKMNKPGIDPEVKAALARFETVCSTGKNAIEIKFKNLQLFFGTDSQIQFNLTQKLSESLLKLGDEVNKLPLGNIPDQAILDLKRTITRKGGDRLYFKAVLTKESSEKGAQEEKTIEFTSLGLYQIELHNSLQAVLILADNLSNPFNSKKQFQFAPSYSTIFKVGSRKHSFYNDYIELGLGLNFATLDFNNDDNPEVGIGVVFSAFKDYLQIGYGRNIGLDKNYWFFGIRLPFLGMDLNGKSKLLPLER